MHKPDGYVILYYRNIILCGLTDHDALSSAHSTAYVHLISVKTVFILIWRPCCFLWFWERRSMTNTTSDRFKSAINAEALAPISTGSWYSIDMVPTDLEKCLNLTTVLKSAWFFNLPWKLAIFFEQCLGIYFMDLKNNGPTNLICLCVFYACCMLDFNKKTIRGFGNIVIKSPVTTGPVIHVFNGEYCN